MRGEIIRKFDRKEFGRTTTVFCSMHFPVVVPGQTEGKHYELNPDAH
jgi:hypothetical protein